tara:strand:- start:36 stop:347 length:312 start_codon:yes stop_codon:yes gene_type:complete
MARLGADHQGCVSTRGENNNQFEFSRPVFVETHRRPTWMLGGRATQGAVAENRVLLESGLYKVHPVLCPSGHPSDVQNGSRPFCLGDFFWLLTNIYGINMEQF